MKACSPKLAAHYAGGQLTTAICVLLIRTDGTVMGFTELDQDIRFQSPRLLSAELVIYKAEAGFVRFNQNERDNLQSSNIQLSGMIDGFIVTADDIRERRYDYPDVQIFEVNWMDLTQDCLIRHTGKGGTATIKEFAWEMELFGLSEQLTRIGGELCSPNCRVDFGSPRCAPGGTLGNGLTIDSIMQTGTVISTDGFGSMVVSGISSDTYPISGGLLTWTGGSQINLSIEIKQFVPDTNTLTLYLPSLVPIVPGDTFQVLPACDKTFATCRNVYGNVVNMQAEPSVPNFKDVLNHPDYHYPSGDGNAL